MQNVIIHLIGSPGVGKYTVASELARQTGARLVDNHSIANVVFNVIAPDGVTPLPDAIWPRVARVRAAVLDTIANVSPPGLSFVFTNFIAGENASEYAVFLEFVALAEGRKSTYVPVVLSCRTDELVRRIGSEQRRQRMKLIDPIEGARLNDEVPRFTTDHPNAFALDVTTLAPKDAAGAILEWTERCRLSNP